jgi:hypothetical protein
MKEAWRNLGQALKEEGRVKDAERAVTKVRAVGHVCVFWECVFVWDVFVLHLLVFNVFVLHLHVIDVQPPLERGTLC